MTAATVAVKLALVAPAGTSTAAGKETAVLLLVKLTVRPPDPAADVSVTLQASEPEPDMFPFAQLIALSAAAVGLS